LKAEKTLAPLIFGTEIIYGDKRWKDMVRHLTPFRGTKL